MVCPARIEASEYSKRTVAQPCIPEELTPSKLAGAELKSQRVELRTSCSHDVYLALEWAQCWVLMLQMIQRIALQVYINVCYCMLGRLVGGPLSAIATRRGRMATNPVPRVVGISTCFRLDGLWRAWVAFHYLADCQRFCCPCPPLGLRQKITRHMTYTHTRTCI